MKSTDHSKIKVLKKYQSFQEYKNILKHCMFAKTLKYKVRKCGTVNLPGSGHHPKLTEESDRRPPKYQFVENKKSCNMSDGGV